VHLALQPYTKPEAFLHVQGDRVKASKKEGCIGERKIAVETGRRRKKSIIVKPHHHELPHQEKDRLTRQCQQQ